MHVDDGVPVSLGIPHIPRMEVLYNQSRNELATMNKYVLSKSAEDLQGPKVPQRF